MRLLFTALLIAGGVALPAQERFDTRGLPADAALVLVTAPAHGLQISNTAPAMQALRARVEKLSAKTQALGNDEPDMEKAVRDEFGINTDDNDNTIALGLKIAGPGDISGVGILRVKVDPKRVDAFARKRGVAPLTAGGRTGWNALQLLDALANPKGGKVTAEPDEAPWGVFVLDNNTVVISSAEEAAACFARLADKAPSFALNAAHQASVAGTGKGYLFATMDLSRLPPEIAEEIGRKNGVTAVTLVAGEKGPDQFLELSGDYTSAAKAKAAAQQLQGFLSAAPLLLAIDPAETVELQALKKVGAELVAAIQPMKIAGQRASFTVSIKTARLFAVAGQTLDLLEKEADAQAVPQAKATGGKKTPGGTKKSK
ncbi:hypothetical protein EMGBS10_18830 [Opitutia bacterium]|nr:hypothetical protein EMGBS10_18830 [Opitutae bacterium]